MGYNPNDCVEYRWGPLLDLKNIVPAAVWLQPLNAKMEAVRLWFKKRLHPPT